MADEEKQPTTVQTRYPLPPNPDSTVQNWVVFGGELRMKEIWAIADAETSGDTKVMARMLPRIIREWSVTGENDEPLDPADFESYAELTLSQYRALAEAASTYITESANVGN